MGDRKLEYDASLGGRVTLPTHVSTYHYAASAFQEVQTLINEAQLPTNSKLIFQTLPKHMRRRAMSHHPKRLPRKYRAAHKSQMSKSGNQPVNNRRPSRKYRRRPQNLMQEYVRRQRKHNWLETHIWHAKRFHMINRWGYRLPYASCDKTYRACYRASVDHCLLQDMSFYRCLELQSTKEQLHLGFERLTSPNCGLGITAKTFIRGDREGSIELFADGQYPYGALQRAYFMWRPHAYDRYTLWLWLHPSAAERTISELVKVFQLKSTKQQKLPLLMKSKQDTQSEQSSESDESKKQSKSSKEEESSESDESKEQSTSSEKEQSSESDESKEQSTSSEEEQSMDQSGESEEETQSMEQAQKFKKQDGQFQEQAFDSDEEQEQFNGQPNEQPNTSIEESQSESMEESEESEEQDGQFQDQPYGQFQEQDGQFQEQDGQFQEQPYGYEEAEQFMEQPGEFQAWLEQPEEYQEHEENYQEQAYGSEEAEQSMEKQGEFQAWMVQPEEYQEHEDNYQEQAYGSEEEEQSMEKQGEFQAWMVQPEEYQEHEDNYQEQASDYENEETRLADSMEQSEEFEEESTEGTQSESIEQPEILQEHIENFQEPNNESEDEEETSSEESEKSAKQSDKAKSNGPHFWTKTKAFELNRKYSNSDKSIEMEIFEHEFNRFRLTGRRAQEILRQSLRAYFPRTKDPYWMNVYGIPRMKKSFQSQAEFMESALKLNSPNQLLSNMIVGVNVVDPRLQRPQKRTKLIEDVQDLEEMQTGELAANLLISQPLSLPDSLLWLTKTRQLISKSIWTTHEYEQMRQRHAVVPGQRCAFEDQMQPIPMILIQRPGSQESQYNRLGYGSGWDVIAPANCGMSLWLTLNMYGARPGGLREFDSVAREAGVEQHLPDTLPGIKQATENAAEKRDRYFRLPPNKRCNYRKLAIVSPFKAPWEYLVRDWRKKSAVVPSNSSFYVLRDLEMLQQLDQCVRNGEVFPKLQNDCLIQIQLRMHARGQLKDNAIICLPTNEDWKRQRKQLKKGELGPIYTEPLQPDVNEGIRKKLRLEHKLKLKRLRARRVREKRKAQETATKRVHIRAANNANLIKEQLSLMCDLWLPTAPGLTKKSVRRQCSREVFGYVNTAGFSYIEGKVCGVGYVTAGGLKKLMADNRGKDNGKGNKSRPPLCLVRDPDSRDYRFANFKVNCNVTISPF